MTWARVFVLCFGQPKPLHELLIRNWSKVKCIHFVLITDVVQPWNQLVGMSLNNIEVVMCSISDYFERGAQILCSVDFMTDYGKLVFNKMNGWTACGLRPLLNDMFPSDKWDWWGYMDYDVLLNGPAIERHLQVNMPNRNLLMFPQDSFVWEQFKLHHKCVSCTGIWKHVANLQMQRDECAVCPMEALVSYHMRSLFIFQGGDIEQSEIVVHWRYLDGLDTEHDKSVELLNDTELQDCDTGRKILFFVADTEVKEDTNSIRTMFPKYSR